MIRLRGRGRSGSGDDGTGLIGSLAGLLAFAYTPWVWWAFRRTLRGTMNPFLGFVVASTGHVVVVQASMVRDSFVDARGPQPLERVLVMGCYGHSRAREWMLGGTSRSILGSMTLPVLMAH